MNTVLEPKPILPRKRTPAIRAQPDVSVVVVNYNTAHLLGRMFAALEDARGDLQLQTIVVDNASRDNSVDVLRTQHPNAELIQNSANAGFGRANNQALARASGHYVLLLNTDAFVAPDTLAKTVSFMDAHPAVGVLGVKLVGEDGSLQPSCRYFPTPWNTFLASTGLARFFPRARLVDDLSWDHASVRECDWVPGCYYLVRREVIDQVGLFDPRYFLYCEEVDHCQAVRKAGWSVIYYPFTQVVHVGGESASSEAPLNSVSRQISALQVESELLYLRKHHGVMGTLTAVCLAALSDALKTCNAVVRHRDWPPAAAAMRHSWVTLQQLVATGARVTPDPLNCRGRGCFTSAHSMFDHIREDFRSYEGRWGAQGFWAMVVYRFGRWRYGVHPAILRKLLSLIYRVLFKMIQIITGIELPCEVVVGRNFVIDHFGGIIISGYAKFGDDCRIRNGVVVGLRRVDEKCAPSIGNNVDIGAGAKLLGPIRIGDNVLIGANSVVLIDVPDNSVAVGVPAVVKPQRVYRLAKAAAAEAP